MNDSRFCMQWQSLLAATHPDDFPSDIRAAFEAHLTSCSECSAVLDEQKQTDLLLRRALLPERPLPTWQDILHRKERGAVPSSVLIGGKGENESFHLLPKTQQQGSLADLSKVLILAASQYEFDAACNHLSHLGPEVRRLGMAYRQGVFHHREASYDVEVVHMASHGSLQASIYERLIKASTVLIILDCCHSTAMESEDITAGDVVVTFKNIFATQSLRQQTDKLVSDHLLFQCAHKVAQETRWLRHPGDPPPVPAPRVVITSSTATKRLLLSTEVWSTASSQMADGIETISSLSVPPIHFSIGVLTIRGMVDPPEWEESEQDIRRNAEIAARHASAFAFELLARFGEGR